MRVLLYGDMVLPLPASAAVRIARVRCHSWPPALGSPEVRAPAETLLLFIFHHPASFGRCVMTNGSEKKKRRLARAEALLLC